MRREDTSLESTTAAAAAAAADLDGFDLSPADVARIAHCSSQSRAAVHCPRGAMSHMSVGGSTVPTSGRVRTPV